MFIHNLQLAIAALLFSLVAALPVIDWQIVEVTETVFVTDFTDAKSTVFVPPSTSISSTTVDPPTTSIPSTIVVPPSTLVSSAVVVTPIISVPPTIIEPPSTLTSVTALDIQKLDKSQSTVQPTTSQLIVPSAIPSALPSPTPSAEATSSDAAASSAGGVCTTGDSYTGLGFYITNAGSIDATYYIYASIDAEDTSEEDPFKCAEVNSGSTIFVSIPAGLNGRINRGLPFTATPTHPSRGPASWFEFNHDVAQDVMWGDISLIQGYDGAISVIGSTASFGFNYSLPLDVASKSFPAALTTKTSYPNNIPAPTVIGPTVQTDVVSNQQAFAFYAEGFPGGPCGNLQEVAYVSNDPQFNPNFETDNVYNVTFYDGII